MISADFYKKKSSLEISSENQSLDLPESCQDGSFVYIKSDLAEGFFGKLLESKTMKVSGMTFLLHGSDETISVAIAQEMTSRGCKIKSVNWLGDTSLVEPIPIGLPTFERLSNVSTKEYDHFMSKLNYYRRKTGIRDIHLYANFDITTNLPIRKTALLAALRLKDSYSPLNRIGLAKNLELLSRSEFVLSPPGAGPDCFRTWEAIYLGAVPIVLKSHWPFSHLDLPVLIVESFENLEQDIIDFGRSPRIRNDAWEDLFHFD